MFKLSPIEAAEAKGLSMRSPHTVLVKWLYFPQKGGKKYRKYLKAKSHVETQIKWLAILSTDELFRIKEAIRNGIVPDFFKEIVASMYQAKQKGQFVVSIEVGDKESVFPLFEYEDETKWNNPGIPTDTITKTGPAEILLPKPKVNVPKIPQSVIQTLNNAKKG